jgi:hypothetical protein
MENSTICLLNSLANLHFYGYRGELNQYEHGFCYGCLFGLIGAYLGEFC